AAIEARQEWAFVIGIDDVGIARVRDDVTAFAAADGGPIAAIDVAVIGAGGDADGGIVLLRAVDAIEEIVVGGDVVELGGGLIVLRSPIFAGVNADGGAAVVTVDHAGRIVGIDPQSVVVAVRSQEALEGFAAVGGAEEPGVCDVDGVRVLGIG